MLKRVFMRSAVVFALLLAAWLGVQGLSLWRVMKLPWGSIAVGSDPVEQGYMFPYLAKQGSGKPLDRWKCIKSVGTGATVRWVRPSFTLDPAFEALFHSADGGRGSTRSAANVLTDDAFLSPIGAWPIVSAASSNTDLAVVQAEVGWPWRVLVIMATDEQREPRLRSTWSFVRVLPDWWRAVGALAAIAFVTVALASWLIARRRALSGRCVGCGHALASLPVCPECGVKDR